MSVIPFPTGRRVPEFDQADRLRKSAKLAGLTSRQIAEALGIHESTVSGWINGSHRPSRQTVMIWSQMTDVDFRWLDTGDLPTTPPPPRGGSTTPGPIMFVGPEGLEPSTRGLKVRRLIVQPHHLLEVAA